MVRNLELWQGERAMRGRGATGTGRRAQEIAAVAGRSQLANIFISIARCATGCQDKLGLLCLCPRPLATCVSGICVCAAAIDTGHTRTGKARASALCQRDAAQRSADKTSLGRMIYAKVSWLPAHLLCLLWSWDLRLPGCGACDWDWE